MLKHIFPAGFAVAAMMAVSTPAAAKAPVEGRWVTQDKDAIIEIKPCGTSICGRIIRFLVAPPVRNPKDTNNPNKKLRSRPIMGMAVLSGFRAEKNGRYRGKVYDPKSGKTYKSFLKLNPNGTLKMQGCIGPFCQTQTWRRAK